MSHCALNHVIGEICIRAWKVDKVLQYVGLGPRIYRPSLGKDQKQNLAAWTGFVHSSKRHRHKAYLRFWSMHLFHRATDSTKINRPVHSIHMYWTNFRQPTAHVQQNIFGKTLTEVCSLHLYASFGTFCVQIGQLFASQWVLKHSEEFRNRRHFPSKTANCRFSNIL